MNDAEHNPRRFDPKSLDKLEAPDRGRYFPVEAALDAIGACSMLNVADIGAGIGYYALPLARRVAPGSVYAVEPAAELLDYMRGKLRAPDAPANIKLAQAEAEATGLETGGCDLILLSALWHEIDDHAAALAEFARIAAPNAKLAILDWCPEAASPPGPPVAHRIARPQVESSLEAAGWGVVKSDVLTPWTYLVVAQR
jgi:ubiquinone/menaquinone biosynthesis C-methylase UbiE